MEITISNRTYQIEPKADLRKADLREADLREADLAEADLAEANLTRADLRKANLTKANLARTELIEANLIRANLTRVNLTKANLTKANLIEAQLIEANLTLADLTKAKLTEANLIEANLTGVKGLSHVMGVAPGKYYYKRFNEGLCNQGYQYHVGLNTLRQGEIFADDERVLCSYPGFHFASKSWCARVNRPLEALIRIPADAKINEPWATDGKASADKIEIVKIWEVATGKDVTKQYR